MAKSQIQRSKTCSACSRPRLPRQGLQHAVCWLLGFRRGCLLTFITMEEPPDYYIKSCQKEENVDHRREALTYTGDL